MSENESLLFWLPVEDGCTAVSDDKERAGQQAQPTPPQEPVTSLEILIAQPRVEQIQEILTAVTGVEQINFWFEDAQNLGIFSALEACDSLKALGVYDDDEGLTVEHFEEIAGLSSLRKIRVGCTNFSKEKFAPLAEMKHLEAFSLQESDGVDADILRLLPRMQGLRELFLEINDWMVDEVVLNIESLSQLQSLSFDYSGEALSLSLEGGLSFLRKMRGLRTFSLRRYLLDAAQMADIARCESIEHLTLDSCDWKKGTLEGCAAMPNLRRLQVVSFDPEQPVDWHFLEQIQTLTEFSFEGTEISKTLSRVLPQLRGLQRLELTGAMDEKGKEKLLAALPSTMTTVLEIKKKGTAVWIKWLVQWGTSLAVGAGGGMLLYRFGMLTEGWMFGLFFVAIVAGAVAETYLTE
ncbi:hypothetical protein L6R29_00795 [Myxococcota bacterium]|nr:hypothetical protein [Myxococcota bacterium]